MRKSLSFLISFLSISVLVVSPRAAGKITHENYIEYLPLSDPKIMGQTEASAALHLYGNPEADGYKDVSPIDGIDDERWRRLLELSAKFSPVLYKNTSSIPLDFKAVVNREVTPLLHIDTWDLTRAEKKIVEQKTINFGFVDSTHHGDRGSLNLIRALRFKLFHANSRNDRKLLNLIGEFNPQKGRMKPKVNPNQQTFKVLYFDFPGEDAVISG